VDRLLTRTTDLVVQASGLSVRRCSMSRGRRLCGTCRQDENERGWSLQWSWDSDVTDWARRGGGTHWLASHADDKTRFPQLVFSLQRWTNRTKNLGLLGLKIFEPRSLNFTFITVLCCFSVGVVGGYTYRVITLLLTSHCLRWKWSPTMIMSMLLCGINLVEIYPVLWVSA